MKPCQTSLMEPHTQREVKEYSQRLYTVQLKQKQHFNSAMNIKH